MAVNTGSGALTLDLMAAARGRLPASAEVELSTVDRPAGPLPLGALELAPHEAVIARF